jgi:hypothetical protein
MLFRFPQPSFEQFNAMQAGDEIVKANAAARIVAEFRRIVGGRLGARSAAPHCRDPKAAGEALLVAFACAQAAAFALVLLTRAGDVVRGQEPEGVPLLQRELVRRALRGLGRDAPGDGGKRVKVRRC